MSELVLELGILFDIDSRRPCKINCIYDCHLGVRFKLYFKALKVLIWVIVDLPLTHFLFSYNLFKIVDMEG